MTPEAAPRLYDRIVEVLHRYECDDEPPGHDWQEHLPEDEPPFHPNRVDGLVALFEAEAAAGTAPAEGLLAQERLIADLTWALSRHENALLFGTLESPREIAETLVADIVKARHVAAPAEGVAEALERLRDHGYQPGYNGRPSCPFCGNFVDDEETHTGGCVLVAALARHESAGSE